MKKYMVIAIVTLMMAHAGHIKAMDDSSAAEVAASDDLAALRIKAGFRDEVLIAVGRLLNRGADPARWVERERSKPRLWSLIAQGADPDRKMR